MPQIAWSLDCAPAIQTSKDSEAPVLVIVDDFSKFVILVPMESLTSTNVANAFLERVLAAYGRPMRVRIDGGSEFMKDFRGLVEGLGIDLIVTNPLSPWANGIAERMVHFCKGLVRKTLLGVPKD